MIVGRPLRAMFVHKVRELGVLRLLSVRVEVVTDLVHVHGDPWLVAVVCVAHTSVGPVPEVVIYGRSASVVVDDVATFVDLEHGLEFTVDYYYVHGLFQCGCKVHLDAEITLPCQMETVLTL